MAKRKAPKTQIARQELPDTGPGRYHHARFMADCAPATEAMLRKAFANGDQLVAKRVPIDGLPVVVILAAYLRDYGAELVDDYDVLLDRYWEHKPDCAHNDKFFASCIYLLHQRGQVPEDAAYTSINVPGIYEELFNA